MTDDSVVIEKRGAALWITINRPDKRNASTPGWSTVSAAAIAPRMTTPWCG